ncbi:MAG: threonine/serine dehydratase [Alphaproteobacteria bacterium]|nr:threonine/serine dehydratase [Alphaproteobacteria bacterium]
MTSVPTLDEIRATRALIDRHVLTTPIHTWRGREIGEAMGSTEPVLKLELFQHTGSFKARGAVAVMLNLSKEQLGRGVVTISAGNHAIATAYAAKTAGTSAKVVMAKNANPTRVARAKAYGAEVVSAENVVEGFELVKKIEAAEGRSFVHPFEGPWTSKGTGTLGLEFSDQAGPLDAVIVPIGGGGLASGVSTAIKLAQPSCKVYGVEPAGADAMSRSFKSGKPERLEKIDTIADSLAPPFTTPLAFELCRRHIDEIVLVDDQALRRAMALLFREMKLAVEPAGAAATAGMLGPLKSRLEGKRVGLIVCGANIGAADFAEAVRLGEAG